MIKNTLSKVQELFRGKQMAYVQTFKGPYSHIVLQDLARFCRAHDSTFGKDERSTYLLEGRREVWLRIQNFLNLTNEEIYALHHVKSGDSGG